MYHCGTLFNSDIKHGPKLNLLVTSIAFLLYGVLQSTNVYNCKPVLEYIA